MKANTVDSMLCMEHCTTSWNIFVVFDVQFVISV